MKVLVGFLISLSLVGCTHLVHSLEVSQGVVATVEQALKPECGGSCEIDKCWYETEVVLVCRISFSFTPDYQQSEILQTVSQNLAKDNIQVGFCAEDSVGTVFASALLGGLVGGIAAGAVGGDHYTGAFIGSSVAGRSSDEAYYIDPSLIHRACESIPHVPSAAKKPVVVN